MLRFWLVTCSIYFVSFGADVDFTFEKSCYSEAESMKLTAVYTGSGDVTAVQWTYSDQVGSNLFVTSSTCAVFGTVPAGFPNGTRMSYDCDTLTNTYNLTLSSLEKDDFGKSWGATFSLSSGGSPAVQKSNLTMCTSTITSTTSSSHITTNNTNMTHAATSSQPSTTTTKSPDNHTIIIISVAVGGTGIMVIICFCSCKYIRKKREKVKKMKRENNKKEHETVDNAVMQQAADARL